MVGRLTIMPIVSCRFLRYRSFFNCFKIKRAVNDRCFDSLRTILGSIFSAIVCMPFSSLLYIISIPSIVLMVF
jgi:hypothetical protein